MAEAILRFLIDDAKLGRSSTYSAHRSWLQRTKPEKHIATGATVLASGFHAQYIRFSALPKNTIYIPYYSYLHTEGTRSADNTLHCRLRSLSILLRVVGHLLTALLWLLPKAGFSETLVHYSKRMLPRVMYQHDIVLVRRVRNCLDRYTTRVQNARLEELGGRVEKGEPSAYPSSVRNSNFTCR